MKPLLFAAIKLRRLLLVLSVALTTGCGTTVFPKAETVDAAKTNVENLSKLQVGNSRAEVLLIMGPPNSTRRYPQYAEHLDYWLYFTGGRGILDPGHSLGSYTLLAFEGDTLRGWGKDYEVVPVSRDHPFRQKLYSDANADNGSSTEPGKVMAIEPGATD